jgi:hypothetical protein
MARFNPLKFYYVIMMIFYVPGFFIAVFFSSIHLYSLELALILLISCIFTFLGWHSVTKAYSYSKLKFENIIVFFFVIYLITLIVIFNSNPIALFNLDNPFVIAELRENATKGKTGFDGLINLIYFSSSYFALPLVILKVYEIKHKFRHVVFIFTLISLLFTLEKARSFIIFIPLAFYLFSRFGYRKLIVIFLFFYFLLFFTSKIVGLDIENLSIYNYPANAEERAVKDESKFLFAEASTEKFLINRTVWIPFITAIDWLKYKNDILQNNLLYGATIPLLGDVFSRNGRYRIENEIYKFQFDASAESLGSSNSHFALDAYLNFSWLGIVVYSFFFGYILSKLYHTYSSPYNFVFYNYAFSATVANLHSLLLGGGLLLFLLVNVQFKKYKNG